MRAYATEALMRREALQWPNQFPHGTLAYAADTGTRWVMAPGGWVEYFPDIVDWRTLTRNMINARTPEETPMHDKTYIPEPGDDAVWHSYIHGALTISKPIHMIAEYGDQLWGVMEGASVAGIWSKASSYGYWEKIVPKEALEEPQPTTGWLAVHQDGQLGSVVWGSSDIANESTAHPAVVQCDVIPRLDTLKRVER